MPSRDEMRPVYHCRWVCLHCEETKPQKGKQNWTLQTLAQGARGGSQKKNMNHTSECYNCSGYGHWARNCPSPKNKRDGGQQKEVKKDALTNDQDKNRGGPSTACGLFSAIETSMFLGESPVIRLFFFLIQQPLAILHPRLKTYMILCPSPTPDLSQQQMVPRYIQRAMELSKLKSPIMDKTILWIYRMSSWCQIYIHICSHLDSSSKTGLW